MESARVDLTVRRYSTALCGASASLDGGLAIYRAALSCWTDAICLLITASLGGSLTYLLNRYWVGPVWACAREEWSRDLAARIERLEGELQELEQQEERATQEVLGGPWAREEEENVGGSVCSGVRPERLNARVARERPQRASGCRECHRRAIGHAAGSRPLRAP